MKGLLFFVFALLASTLYALSDMQVPAVDVNSQGIITHIQASVSPGNGGVFVDVEPFISVETQNSAKIAARVAAQKAQVNLSGFNVFFKVIANTESVDGPSGGLALGLLAYTEFTGKKLRTDITATGSIELDGSVGQVGGIVEKINAAAKTGIRLMLIPLGQRIQNGVDVTQYAESRWGIQVVEVKNLDEALSFAFTKKGERVVVPERVEPPLILEDLSPILPAYLTPMKDLAAGQERALQRTQRQFPETSVIATLIKKSANTTRTLLEKGYYYSAANEAFLAQIQADAFALSNTSKSLMIEKVNLLRKEIDAFKLFPVNDKNIEWAVGSRLRLQWAKKRLSEVQEKIALSETALPLLQDYAASYHWFSAARQMNEIASSFEGKPLQEEDWKGYAQERLVLANKTLRQNPLDSEAVFHLQTSQQAFADKEYITSTFDSSFVIAFAHARGKLVQEAARGSLPQEPANTQNLRRHLSVWSNLYYTHALYSIQEANRSGDFGYLVNAFKLVELSQELDSNLKRLSEAPPLPPVTIPSTEVVVPTVPLPASGSNPYLLAAAVVLVVVVLAGLTVVFFRKPEYRPSLRIEEKIDLLEQRLLEGKISEKTYEKLAKKFEAERKRK